jgi:hypothetical protein
MKNHISRLSPLSETFSTKINKPAQPCAEPDLAFGLRFSKVCALVIRSKMGTKSGIAGQAGERRTLGSVMVTYVYEGILKCQHQLLI